MKRAQVAAKARHYDMALPSRLRAWNRANGAAFDEYCRGEARAGQGLLPLAQLHDPAGGMADNGFFLPGDMGNLWLAPVEERMVIGTEQGNIARGHQAPVREMLLGGDKELGFIEQDRRGWGIAK